MEDLQKILEEFEDFLKKELFINFIILNIKKMKM